MYEAWSPNILRFVQAGGVFVLSERLISTTLSYTVQHGSLKVIFANGQERLFGNGEDPSVTIRFSDSAAQRALCLNPELHFGELYVDGRMTVEQGTFMELLQLLLQDNHGEFKSLPLASIRRLRKLILNLKRTNKPIASKRNVEHHYNLNGQLYDLFLDADRQYSCAYFERSDMTLDEAQLSKKRHIVAKLMTDAEHDVIDIGCGWGGMALYLARTANVRSVTGVTLSTEQLDVAKKRMIEASVGNKVSFRLEDYRETRGKFDRIVSVGMFEHVGIADYPAFFDTCSRLLKDDGVILLHAIGRSGQPFPTNEWITKYIFPGGHLPVLSELTPVIEKSGLIITDIEILRLHYATTLRIWRERFMARRDEAKALYDERFCRIWETYLSMSEAAFLWEDVVVFQIQMTKRNDTLPITRDYIHEREQHLRKKEQLGKLKQPMS